MKLMIRDFFKGTVSGGGDRVWELLGLFGFRRGNGEKFINVLILILASRFEC